MKLKDPTPSRTPPGGSPLLDQQPKDEVLVEQTGLLPSGKCAGCGRHPFLECTCRPPEQTRQAMLEAVRQNAEGPLSGEVSTARYSPETIALARELGKLRVTPSGLGYIRGIEPDLPELGL